MFFSNFLQVALYVGTEVEASAPDLESRKFLLVMQDAQIAHADMEDLTDIQIVENRIVCRVVSGLPALHIFGQLVEFIQDFPAVL